MGNRSLSGRGATKTLVLLEIHNHDRATGLRIGEHDAVAGFLDQCYEARDQFRLHIVRILENKKEPRKRAIWLCESRPLLFQCNSDGVAGRKCRCCHRCAAGERGFEPAL